MFRRAFALFISVALIIPALHADEIPSQSGAAFKEDTTTSTATTTSPAVTTSTVTATPTEGNSVATPVFETQDANGSFRTYTSDLSNHTPISAGVRSLLVPGWGQAFNGQDRKGALFFGVTAILAVSAVATYNDAQNKYDDYKATGQKDSSTYNDYTDRFNLSVVLAVLTTFFWGFSVFDAARNSSAAQANSSSTQLAIGPHGEPQVVYERKF